MIDLLDVLPKCSPRVLRPDLPEEHKIVLGNNISFREAARYAARKRYIAMNKRQAAIARDLDSYEHKSVDGLGQHYLRVDAEIVAQMQAKYGQDCWGDDEFIEAFHRDNPACRVKTTRGTRGQELRK